MEQARVRAQYLGVREEEVLTFASKVAPILQPTGLAASEGSQWPFQSSRTGLYRQIGKHLPPSDKVNNRWEEWIWERSIIKKTFVCWRKKECGVTERVDSDHLRWDVQVSHGELIANSKAPIFRCSFEELFQRFESRGNPMTNPLPPRAVRRLEMIQNSETMCGSKLQQCNTAWTRLKVCNGWISLPIRKHISLTRARWWGHAGRRGGDAGKASSRYSRIAWDCEMGLPLWTNTGTVWLVPMWMWRGDTMMWCWWKSSPYLGWGLRIQWSSALLRGCSRT